jgi:hypothetical protein
VLALESGPMQPERNRLDELLALHGPEHVCDNALAQALARRNVVVAGDEHDRGRSETMMLLVATIRTMACRRCPCLHMFSAAKIDAAVLRERLTEGISFWDVGRCASARAWPWRGR